MLLLIVTLVFIVLYIYAIKKTKKLFTTNNFKFSRPSLKYCFYLLAIYSLVPMIIIIIIGKGISSHLIKFFLFNNNIPNNSEIAYQSLLNSLDGLSKFSNKNIILGSNFPKLSFYLSNQKLLDLYNQYAFFNYLTNLTLAAIALICSVVIINRLIKKFKATTNFQKKVEKIIEQLLFVCSTVAVFTTLIIIVSLFLGSLSFFERIPFFNFILGTKWTPENSGFDPLHSFGVLPLLVGTFLIAFIAIIVALIIAVPSAIYMSEYMPSSLRVIVKPMLEILAGIPTIVYGFFASLTFAPVFIKILAYFHIQASSEAAIIAGITIGIMIVPFISSIADDTISAIPKNMKEGGLALGSMPYEIIIKILLPIAFPGIAGGVLLALSRAIGETMIVLMVSGLTANLTFNPLHSVTTITTQIVTLAEGDQDFGGVATLSLFALGFSLFCITLILNLISFWIIKRFQKRI